jgi:hypothetical protein
VKQSSSSVRELISRSKQLYLEGLESSTSVGANGIKETSLIGNRALTIPVLSSDKAGMCVLGAITEAHIQNGFNVGEIEGVLTVLNQKKALKSPYIPTTFTYFNSISSHVLKRLHVKEVPRDNGQYLLIFNHHHCVFVKDQLFYDLGKSFCEKELRSMYEDELFPTLIYQILSLKRRR